ncbi:MAG TPA: anti-sigma factor [Streptosporangiaceae bacterium]|nr:anti-sigma factor [Streptosporangiaceae bacterium]
MRFSRHDLHTLTGVYALDAVDGSERDLFEHHLRRCRPCGNEVRSLAETATGLAMAAALPPPPRVKERVLAACAVTRQLPPAIDRPSRPVRWAPRQALRRSWTPRLAAAVAVVSLAVAVALGAVGLRTRQELDSARAQDQAIAAVLAAPDARIMSRATTDGGTATVVVSRVEGKVVFTTAGLPRLPASKVYELWLMGPPKIRRAGLLPSPAAGRTAPVLASGLVAGDSVGVTVEPAGGTSRPTTAPIVVMALRV